MKIINNFTKLLISICILLIININLDLLAAPYQVDKIAAIVNDNLVLQSEINEILNNLKFYPRYQSRYTDTEQKLLDIDKNELSRQILERLILDKILLQIAIKMHIEISDKSIDLVIADIAIHNGITVTQLQKILAINGVSFTTYRNNIYKEIIISEVIKKEVKRRINILPQAIDSLSEQIKLQTKNNPSKNSFINLNHISIRLPQNFNNKQGKSVINTVNKIISQLKIGSEFNQLSIIYSKNPNDLHFEKIGWINIQELPNIFYQQIKYAKKGDIIGPICTGIWFHILIVNDIKKDIELYYQNPVTEVKARHILIKISPSMNNEQAYTKIKYIAQQVKNGVLSFSEAARQYSEDHSSALYGGELGWNIPDVYYPFFRDCLIQLNKGEISNPVRSFSGWHLIKLEDTRKINRSSNIISNHTTLKEYAYDRLFNQKFNEEAQVWLQEQRSSAYVEIINGSSSLENN